MSAQVCPRSPGGTWARRIAARRRRHKRGWHQRLASTVRWVGATAQRAAGSTGRASAMPVPPSRRGHEPWRILQAAQPAMARRRIPMGIGRTAFVTVVVVVTGMLPLTAANALAAPATRMPSEVEKQVIMTDVLGGTGASSREDLHLALDDVAEAAMAAGDTWTAISNVVQTAGLGFSDEWIDLYEISEDFYTGAVTVGLENELVTSTTFALYLQRHGTDVGVVFQSDFRDEDGAWSATQLVEGSACAATLRALQPDERVMLGVWGGFQVAVVRGDEVEFLPECSDAPEGSGWSMTLSEMQSELLLRLSDPRASYGGGPSGWPAAHAATPTGAAASSSGALVWLLALGLALLVGAALLNVGRSGGCGG